MSDQETEEKANPCHHCGSKDLSISQTLVDSLNNKDRIGISDVFVLCDTCNAQGPLTASRSSAIQLWNSALEFTTRSR